MRKRGYRLITCILPKGKAKAVLQALKDEKGNICANVTSARGIGKISSLALREAGEQTEKDVLSVVVHRSQAEELFEFIYTRGEIDQPHGGFMYMARLSASTVYTLPELKTEN